MYREDVPATDPVHESDSQHLPPGLINSRKTSCYLGTPRIILGPRSAKRVRRCLVNTSGTMSDDVTRRAALVQSVIKLQFDQPHFHRNHRPAAVLGASAMTTALRGTRACAELVGGRSPSGSEFDDAGNFVPIGTISIGVAF